MPASPSENRTRWRKRKRDSQISRRHQKHEEEEDDNNKNPNAEEDIAERDYDLEDQTHHNHPNSQPYMETKVLSDHGVQISQFPTVIKRSVNHPHSSVTAIVALEHALEFGQNKAPSTLVAPILENVSHDHLQALSSVPFDSFAFDGDSSFVITSPPILEGRGVVSATKLRLLLVYACHGAQAAKRLHLKEHLVLDGSGNLFKLAAPMECKGIVGGDDQVIPRDANYTGPSSRFCILRPKLITAYCRAQASEILKSKEKNPQEADNLVTDSQNVAEAYNLVNDSQNFGDADQLVNDSQNLVDADKDSTKEEKIEDVKVFSSVTTKASEGCEDIVFNPIVFTEFKLAGSPKFIQELCTLEVSPMDGQTLTEALHAHGINVFYIGKDLLRKTEDHDFAPALSHFLNCLFGSCQAPGGKVLANST
ncbi:hypothetical protein JHK82_040119 [Glycine max]|nr:hypothetical protein JHK82_040119 [Glycine max]KAG5122192.1 hypothetical protein JHK84_040532 [Glycine max]